jgi:DNA-binding NarL/FixJ family response regulator
VAEIGRQFGDDDLITCAQHLEGLALLSLGRVAEGLLLLDEAMVSVTSQRLAPFVTGLVYCAVIQGCQKFGEVGRAREWTEALTNWLAQQPSAVAFTGSCLVHRAEILQLGGAWNEAATEAERASARFEQLAQTRSRGTALYQSAEVHRLRGEYDAAEATYLLAGECGVDPQPGLALLRVAQGTKDQAFSTIQRALASTEDRLTRAKLLAAAVEIAVACDQLDAARVASDELQEIANSVDTDMLTAMAADARGAIALATLDFQGAVRALRTALDAWLRMEAPYLAARTRVLMARACHGLDDDDGCAVALSAARAIFEKLGAAPELAAIEDATAQAPRAIPPGEHPAKLSERELEVLRHVAAGESNKEIAQSLHLSVRTVERHLSNIFNKLDVSSRAAATAYAYDQGLV